MSKTNLIVKLTPKASKNSISGWEALPSGEKILKVSVTTAPEKGKANKALIALLSKHFDVPKSKITIARGETSRMKTVEIQHVIDLNKK